MGYYLLRIMVLNDGYVAVYGFFELLATQAFVFLIYIQSIFMSIVSVLATYIGMFLESVLYMTTIL